MALCRLVNGYRLLEEDAAFIIRVSVVQEYCTGREDRGRELRNDGIYLQMARRNIGE